MSTTTTTTTERRGPLAWFGDRSVRVKILSAVVFTAVVGLVVGLMGLRSLSGSADQAHALYENNALAIEQAGEMNVSLRVVRQNARDVLIAPSTEEKNDYVEKVEEAFERFQTAVAAYEATGVDAAEEELLANLQAAVDDYAALQEDVLIPLALESRLAQWHRVNLERGTPIADAMTEDVRGLIADESADAEAAVAAVDDAYASNRLVALLLLTLGIGLALLVGWLVARAISRDVARVKVVTDAMAEGDLTRRAELSTRDEVGVMGASLDAATAKLRDLMTSVIASADSVAAAAEELSASSQQIAAGAEETSVQAGVVSGAADEVSRNVQTVAAGAEQMGASIREIAQSANDAARVASQAVSTVESTNETVAKLGTSSQEIGNVVKVITSIA
ncbi:methyl-accepting chemotaxis protein, partial [Nocardioides sp. SYSU DS0663]|uniref:methyl-accepting chemotaxis protein n=1 Tax=Nocardioides sp. SYSU DS0663 TaxID=3416445 RepID=UPI003F4BA1E9